MADKRIQPCPAMSVDTFYFALCEEDEVGGTEPIYKTPERLPGLVSVAFNPNSQNATFYADGGAYATAAALGELSLSVGLADVPPDIQHVWFGQPYEDGVLLGTQINPPDIAVGYRVKTSGGYRYFWFLKCKASPPSGEITTQGSSINFQSGRITITCVKPMSYDASYRVVDDKDPNLVSGVLPEMIAINWFTDPLWVPEVVA